MTEYQRGFKDGKQHTVKMAIQALNDIDEIISIEEKIDNSNDEVESPSDF